MDDAASDSTGFLLTRHWRDTPAGCEVEFWLATDAGPRCVRIPVQTPVAFIPEAQRGTVEQLLHDERGWELRPLDLLDFQHRPVAGLYCRKYRQLMQIEKRLRQHGLDIFEADVRPPERYLMERFITAPVVFAGQPVEGNPQLLVDGVMKPAPGYRPTIRTVSLDIETTFQGELRSIALEGCGQRQVYMLGPPNGVDGPRDYELDYCATRRELLDRMEAWFVLHDPDAIIGWNVIQFDMRVLQRHAEAAIRN